MEIFVSRFCPTGCLTPPLLPIVLFIVIIARMARLSEQAATQGTSRPSALLPPRRKPGAGLRCVPTLLFISRNDVQSSEWLPSPCFCMATADHRTFPPPRTLLRSSASLELHQHWCSHVGDSSPILIDACFQGVSLSSGIFGVGIDDRLMRTS